MSDPLLDRLISAVGTHYLVNGELGRGGMAAVYRATDLKLNRQVAIKVLPPELAFNADVRARFIREAQTSANLAHPSIVPIYAVGEAEGVVYFTMALVEGETLAERLTREPRLPVGEARQILAGVADALAYAHSRGIVHRDVKPDNIMLDRATGRPMVTDFGIARAAQGETRLTVTGVAIGTPAYMSPEQALGERELDGRSDIYSLGIIGYQMLAGETPFKASNTPAMLVKHVSETPRPLSLLRPDTPSALVHAIGRALAKKPEERWDDAAAFRAAILETREIPQSPQSWQQQSAARETPPPPQYRAPPAPPLPSYRSQAQEGSFFDDGRQSYASMMPIAPMAPMAPMGSMAPGVPMSGNANEWREWRRSYKEWARAQRHAGRDLARAHAHAPLTGLNSEDRLARFRKNAIGSMVTVAGLAAINGLTSPHYPWFLFPGVFITLGVVKQIGSLWADGVPLARIFRRGNPDTHPANRQLSVADLHTYAFAESSVGVVDYAARMVSPDVLNGPYGGMVRRAARDYLAIKDTLARLPETERKMIPDVAPTVDALAERVGALANTLHRLDGDVGGSSPKLLDARVAAIKAEGRGSPSAEQERRIQLLERQRSSIVELTERKGGLVAQLESATIALENLRLDILKLRSSGLDGAMSDVSSATQEARAISREIGNAVDALREVRRL